MLNKASKTLICCSALTLLSACGGGGGGGGGESGTTPVQTFTATTVVNGTGGTITPVSVEVDEGLSTTFTVTAEDGFQIDSVEGCDGTLSGTTFTTSAITADCSVTVSFFEIPTPEFSSPSSTNIEENQNGVVYTASATDPNNETLTFTINGGADQSAFSIDPISGELSLINAADFEAPSDANADGIFEVTLEATNTSLLSEQLPLTVTIDDVSQLALQVSYPTPGARLNGEATTTAVAGIVEDLEDGEILAADVQSLTVNGQSVDITLQTDEIPTTRWRTQLPITTGNNDLTIELIDSGNNSQIQNQSIINQPSSLLLSRRIALDLNNNRLMTLGENDNGNQTVVAIDLDSGENTLILELDNSTDTNPQDIALDSDNNRLLLVDNVTDALTAIDLSTNNQTIISNSSTGNGINFSRPIRVAMDSTNNRALVYDLDRRAIISVDLNNGDRTILSDDNTGTGPSLRGTTELLLDSENNRVLIPNMSLNALLAVDLNSGDRTIISDANTGNGINIDLLAATTLDSANNRVLGFQGPPGANALIAIDLSNGDRSVIIDPEIGILTDIRSLSDAAIDSNNRLVVANFDLISNLLGIDLSNGNQSLILPNTGVGSGRSFVENVDAVTLDATNNRIFTTEFDSRGYLLSVDLSNGNRNVIVGPTTDDPVPYSGIPVGTSVDLTNNRLLLVTRGSLAAVDLDNGDITTLSDENIGEGPTFLSLEDIIIDSTNNRALVVDRFLDAVVAIDLTTGNRSILSDDDTGTGTPLNSPYGLTLDNANNRTLVVDTGLDALIAIDLDSGDRTIISDGIIGNGPILVQPESVALDEENNRALVLDRTLEALIAIDLETGNRSIISGNDTNAGVDFVNSFDFTFDHLHQRAFVTDRTQRAIIVVDLETGERAISSR